MMLRLKRHNRFAHCFESVKIGRYSLSIQGSEGHYCTPRRRTNSENYSNMELAIFLEGRKMQVSKSSIMRNFSRYEELMNTKDLRSTHLFGWVKVELIEELIKYLKKNN